MKIAVISAGYALCACTASASQVEPPADQVFFPTGLAVAPNDSFLFVASANSELRYDSGSISVLDLAAIDGIVADWSANRIVPDGCEQDPDHSETLQCDQTTGAGQKLFIPGAGARVGNFATDIAIQDRGGGRLRLIVPTRGDPSVAWIDWDGANLSCNSSGQSFALCDDTHRLSYVHNDASLPSLPDEPFDAFADSTNHFAMVTHLTTGAITLIDSDPDGNAEISDIAMNLFQPDPLTGLRGATGVAGRSPGAAGDIIYVGSRSEDRVWTMTVGRPVNNAGPYIVPGSWFFLDSLGLASGLSSDTRGMRFSPSGNMLYVINRKPPSVQLIDTSLDATGVPKNKAIGGTNVCRQSSQLAIMDAGDGERAYLTCFGDGDIEVVDPSGIGAVTDIIQVGRGPYAVAAAPTRKKIYVSNFLEDTIAVVDVAPTSLLRDRVVLRIGVPKAPGT